MVKKYTLKEGEFFFKGKVYKAIIHAVEIPKLGKRTALEIAADPEAQAYLVKSGCVGSVIAEVIDREEVTIPESFDPKEEEETLLPPPDPKEEEEESSSAD